MSESHNLRFKKIFKVGKQGIAGAIKNTQTNEVSAFKVSQYMNYLSEHEFNIMTRLKDIEFCPNFCKPSALITMGIEPRINEKTKNPFEIKSKYSVEKSVLLEEFIEGDKLYKHVKYGTCTTETIMSSIKQVLSAIAIAQNETKFTHYDLHSDNIIMKPCDKNDVVLYIVDDSSAFLIPTFGYTPVIIDYGFSYVDALENTFMNTSLGHTDVGFMSDRFDWVTDPKLFLVTLFNEIKRYRKNTDVKILENVTRNIFKNLNIDWECGWDNYKGKSAADIVTSKIEKNVKIIRDSNVFDKYVNYSVDLMCSLITLPLQEKKCNDEDLILSFTAFAKEFLKIEKEISSSQYNLYILKKTIDSARKFKKEYFENENTTEIVSQFRRDVDSAIMHVSKFCSPRKIHYEKMLCALYAFSDCAEGMMYKNMIRRMNEKQEEYDNMSVKNILDILNIINANLEDSDYTYTTENNFIIINAMTKTQTEISLDKDTINILNETPHMLKGMFLSSYVAEGDNELSDDDDIEDEDEDEDEDEGARFVFDEEQQELEQEEDEEQILSGEDEDNE